MFKLFAILACVFALILVVIGVQQVKLYQWEQAEQRLNVSDTNEHKITRCFIGNRFLDISFIVKCLYQASQFDAGSKQSKYELQAQQEIAVWTFTGLFINALMALFTATSLVYIAINLREAKRTTDAANRTAEQAKRSLCEAKRSNDLLASAHIADQRPWIVIKAQVVQITIKDGLAIVDWVSQLENTGKCPAFIIGECSEINFNEMDSKAQKVREEARSRNGIRHIIPAEQVTQISRNQMLNGIKEHDMRGLLEIAIAARYRMQGVDKDFETITVFRCYINQNSALFRRENGTYTNEFSTEIYHHSHSIMN